LMPRSMRAGSERRGVLGDAGAARFGIVNIHKQGVQIFSTTKHAKHAKRTAVDRAFFALFACFVVPLQSSMPRLWRHKCLICFRTLT
jgi:hypothetical protein